MFTAAFYPLSPDPLIPATAPTLNVDETSIKKKKTDYTRHQWLSRMDLAT